MDATSLNIAIIPSKEVKKEAIELSQEIAADFPVQFVLNNSNFLPHITLYQAHFPNADIDSLNNSLLQLVRTLQPVTIHLTIFAVRFGTFLFWNCEKTKELQEFHEKVVTIANPFRNGLILPHLSSLTDITMEDKNDIEQFGALLIGPRYYPHITITRLQDSMDGEKALQKIGASKQITFTVDTVVVGNLGPD